MELIKPSVEIWEQGNTIEDIWKHIARCTRVCYQSTPKNDSETDEEFVERVILRPDSSTGELNFDKIHGAMLEHGTVYLTLKTVCPDDEGYNLYEKYRYNKYSKAIVKQGFVCITTNLRVLYENNWLEDLDYVTSHTEYHFKRVTVSFTTNIGVTREFNRHRVNSIAEESTRYCNYAKPRQISNINNALGSSTIVNDIMPINSQIKIGLPAWLLDGDLARLNEFDNGDWLAAISQIAEFAYDDSGELKYDVDYYGAALYFCNICYNKLIERGWKPQQAREVLPLATKSQLIHTAFVDDWKHFFALRADSVSGIPHPNAKLVAEPLKQEFIKRGLL